MSWNYNTQRCWACEAMFTINFKVCTCISTFVNLMHESMQDIVCACVEDFYLWKATLKGDCKAQPWKTRRWCVTKYFQWKMDTYIWKPVLFVLFTEAMQKKGSILIWPKCVCIVCLCSVCFLSKCVNQTTGEFISLRIKCCLCPFVAFSCLKQLLSLSESHITTFLPANHVTREKQRFCSIQMAQIKSV